jgi:GTP pyrophosphokinase
VPDFIRLFPVISVLFSGKIGSSIETSTKILKNTGILPVRSLFAKIQKQIRKNYPNSNIDIVRKAYRTADQAHHGQTRRSGEPYVMHSLEVAQNLAQLGLDPITCAAGLLHDVLEDTPIGLKELTAEFGAEIASMVDGVTKLSSFSFPDKDTPREVKQAQNIRKMLVATAKDIRVILIKLADRLHNIRTIEHLPEKSRERISRETLDIYAPLAHRLGISQWKWELEDHAFHQLMPVEYKETSSQVAMKRRDRETEMRDTIKFIQQRLAEAEVVAHVIGRPKHLYSIYNKMIRRGRDFSGVMDIQALRIITQTESGCYNALGVVHNLWPPVPGRMKDYVAMPKRNMYQSIHTTIMRPNGKVMEIQIRTEEMDKTAREGIAAHWIYKEGAMRSDKKLDTQLKWLRQMYEWLTDAHAPEELVESMRKDFSTSDVYVFTPKGEVKELPSGATPLDFAYLIHSDVGHRCFGARVNGRMVPVRYHLQTGDVVEILTSKSHHPSPDWVDVVKTGRARTRIRQHLREMGILPSLEEPSQQDSTSATPKTKAPVPVKTPPPTVRHVDEATRKTLLLIDGVKGLAAQFAKCCAPMPGQDIVGYITKTPGVTIHRLDCKSFAKSNRDPKRMIEATWEGEGIYETSMRAVVGARPNVLADITHSLRPMNLDIISAKYAPGKDGESHFDFIFETSIQGIIEQVARTLRTVSGVSEVTELKRKRRLQKAG